MYGFSNVLVGKGIWERVEEDRNLSLAMGGNGCRRLLLVVLGQWKQSYVKLVCGVVKLVFYG